MNGTAWKVIQTIITSIAALIVVSFATGYFTFWKRSISEEISKCINEENAKLFQKLEGSIVDIATKMQLERTSRFKLAIALKNAGVEIPENILYDFSAVSRLEDDIKREASFMEYVGCQKRLSSYSEVLNVKNSRRKGQEYILVAEAGRFRILLAFANVEPSRTKSSARPIEIAFEGGDRHDARNFYELAHMLDGKDILAQPGTMTSDVFLLEPAKVVAR